jgi:hypothetical protein
MQVINWLELQPRPADLEALNERLREAMPLRNVCQLLVETTLHAYPWSGRADLISCYHPSQTYKPSQKIALLVPDPQNVRRTVWLPAQVKHAKTVENSVQGRFQILTLDTYGRQVQMVGGVAEASYPEPNLSEYTPEDLAWLVEWVWETHAAALQATVRKLIEKGQLDGRLAGQTFLPEHASVLSVELLHPFFVDLAMVRPWVSPEEILKGLPDLFQLEHEAALALIRATLNEGPYRALGAERWTTPEVFHQLNRDVPHGLTTPRLRSKVSLWTKQDKQDLAGYGRKSMPVEARRALEELESGDRLPEPDDSPWHPPPEKPVRLPTLNYLHITQAYVPVGYILRAFAPDVQMVFVQFIDGAHQPFLLDRENGLLKAFHPERWRDKILEDGLPAGTSLWLEYEGKEKYRIAPRRLPFKRMVPCKLAHLEDGQLHIQHTQISMQYEGNHSRFKADLHSGEVEVLFAAASRQNLSVRDAMIYAMQEICATDPGQRAHWSDLFNAVFLMRTCSPASVSFLLYTQACFEPLGGGTFRYKPAPEGSARKSRKRANRLSQLWGGFLSNPVAPVPLAIERGIIEARLEASVSASPMFVPDLELPSFLSQPETEPEVSVRVLPFVAVQEDKGGRTTLKDTEPFEALALSNHEPDPFRITRTETAMGMSENGNNDLEESSLRQGERENAEASALSAFTGSVSTGESNPESEESSGAPFDDTRPEFSFFSPTLGLEPKPAWIKASAQINPPVVGAGETRRLVHKPKIPLRPLHKQPFYRRIFFYLRNWLSRSLRKSE